MDFTEIIKREHERIGDTVARLADSSDSALKTRERLSRQLAANLDDHARKEEASLYPALQNHRDAHDGIEGFLAGARAAHTEMQRLAVELDTMPKDDAGFTDKVGELKQATQQHMREEERLLPGLRKALSEEERVRLDEAMAARGEAAAEGVHEGAGAMLRLAGEAATEGVRRVAADRAELAADASRTVRAAAEIYNETAQHTAEDLQTIAACSGIAASGIGEMRQAWMEWVNRSFRAGARASQELLRCMTIEQFADIQRKFMQETLDGLLESSAQILHISSRLSEDAARPIEDRVTQVRRAEERPRRLRRSA